MYAKGLFEPNLLQFRFRILVALPAFLHVAILVTIWIWNMRYVQQFTKKWKRQNKSVGARCIVHKPHGCRQTQMPVHLGSRRSLFVIKKRSMEWWEVFSCLNEFRDSVPLMVIFNWELRQCCTISTLSKADHWYRWSWAGYPVYLLTQTII